MISFRQKATLREIEDSYALVNNSHDGVLRVPADLRYGGSYAVPASLIQFIAVWARSVSDSTLRLYPSGTSAAPGENLAQEPHGIAALYFAGQVSDPVEDVSKKSALAYAIPRIEAMQAGRYRDTMHGRGAFLGCFAGAKNEYLRPFYARGDAESLRSRDEFITLIGQIVAACAPSSERHLNTSRLVAIGSLLYELFKNTHEHASTDEQGVRYRKNLRGVMAKFISVPIEGENPDILSGEDPSYAFFMLRYLANKKRHITAEGRLRAGTQSSFLELTVIDTGPGLIRRWLSKFPKPPNLDGLSIEDEVSIIKRCFEMHATTKDSKSSGGGLDRVVQTLSELKGFLRLRTGRVCLVQDFSSTKANAFAPRHWDPERTALPHTVGAAYSIVIPLSLT